MPVIAKSDLIGKTPKRLCVATQSQSDPVVSKMLNAFRPGRYRARC
jgi:hypothetical protein